MLRPAPGFTLSLSCKLFAAVHRPVCCAVFIDALLLHYAAAPQSDTDLMAMQVSNPLAITYNDSSPHENYHVAAAFLLLQDPELDFMHALPQEVSLGACLLPVDPGEARTLLTCYLGSPDVAALLG